MSATIYIRNISESINLDRLKFLLKREFEQYGTVLDIVVRKNIRLRGQAFVVFDDEQEADRALKAKNGSEFHGTKIDVQLSKQKSDAAVKKDVTPEEFEAHKAQRLQHKKERNERIYADIKPKHNKPKEPKTDRPKKQQKRAPPPTADQDATGASSRLPKNKVLFLENLPATITQEELTEIFSAFPGFFEVRLVAVRRVGFVEYESDDQAAIAREATMGLVKNEQTVKITFAKK